MIGRLLASNRQESAESCRFENYCLANLKKCTTVKVVGGVCIPASFAHYLFRTPSLSGQAFVTDAGLPVSLSSTDGLFPRRRSADPGTRQALPLRGDGWMGHACAPATRPGEGGARCEQDVYGLRCHYARRFRPVATRSASRRCTALARACSARRCCRAVSLAARFSGLPATFSIASSDAAAASSRTPAPPRFADRIARRRCGAVGVRRGELRRPCARVGASDLTHVSQDPLRRPWACAGVAPDQSLQPKDSPCSTRS